MGGKWSSNSDELQVAEDESSSCTIPDALSGAISSWKENIKSIKISPSSVLMGKIWTRLYFSLEKSAEALRPESMKSGAATIMEIFALCVINAFLVEEAEHHLINSGEFLHVDRTNPKTSSMNFIKKKKIEFIADNKANLPLSYVIATCPLIIGLIQATEAAIDSFSKLFNNAEATKNDNKENAEATKNDNKENAEATKNDNKENAEATENNKKEKAKNLLCSNKAWKEINSFYIVGVNHPEPRSKSPVNNREVKAG